jgi:NTP pyrophosphatase (non-canonical NTP hydrolase)
MEMKKLLDFIEEVDGYFLHHYPNLHGRERVYARMVKLSEEVGELADEVLSSQSDQRREKLAVKEDDALSNEVADVLITTLMLARSFNVDVVKALERKMQKIQERISAGDM